MEIIAQRLRALRENVRLPQAKLAAMVGTTQSAINRYENAQSIPPANILLWYADHFDVSMDYLYGRTDKPQGTLYEYKPLITADNEQLRQFIEMCFDPESTMHDRLKQTLMDMVTKESGDNQ